MNATYCNSSQRLAGRLAELGFCQVGGAVFESSKFRLELGPTWSTFRANRSGRMTDPLVGQLGLPGPWKRVSRGGRCRLVADVPTRALRDHVEPDAEEGTTSPLALLIEWLTQTCAGRPLANWHPPDPGEIESWYGPEKLTVVVGPYVRQGTLHRAAGRLSVQIPLVPRIPPQLPESRWNWLRAVLIDAQNRHRAARIGLLGEAPQLAVVAEFDLSGAPTDALQSLFTTSLAALMHSVQWAIQSANFLVNLEIESRALEAHPDPLSCEST